MWCNLIQWIISSSHDEGKAVYGFARRHINKCPACRQFEQNIIRLEKKLRQSPLPTTSTEFVLHNDAQPAVLHLIFRRPVLVTAAAAAVIIAITVISVFVQMSDSQPSTSITIKIDRPETINISLPLNPGESVDRSVMTIQKHATDSMEREFNNITSDARTASIALIGYLPGDMEGPK